MSLLRRLVPQLESQAVLAQSVFPWVRSCAFPRPGVHSLANRQWKLETRTPADVTSGEDLHCGHDHSGRVHDVDNVSLQLLTLI
jgi:hypothetical protein